MSDQTIRVGCAAGYWGDASLATPQLLAGGSLDYLVFDYLAEITMSIMARARAARPESGYALDFVSSVLKPNLKEIARQGVKVISNAGGVNPHACGEAIRSLTTELNLGLKVAVVAGDDLMAQVASLSDSGTTEMFSGHQFPDQKKLASVNAYLGAFPIAQALSRGADIVVTGRVVDSAVTLAACINEFGWAHDDLDQLAGGSLAGHILECTGQATGGNFTDWESVADTCHEIGYPIAEIADDGSFVCTKPDNTGGIVTTGTVAEQMLYEIGDPQSYILPDVTCDFSRVQISQVGPDRVSVSGALGRVAPDSYKVSATYSDGYRGGQVLFFYGFDADRKARCFADAALIRSDRRLQQSGLGSLTETCIEVIGDESHYGKAGSMQGSREVAVKIAGKHPSAKGITVLLQEIIGMALAGPPGLTMFSGGGRPKPSPVVRLFSFLIPKSQVKITVGVEGDQSAFSESVNAIQNEQAAERPQLPAPVHSGALMIAVPLIKLALGRSGDKGNHANVGIIARKPEFLPYIWSALTEDVVRKRFEHFIEGSVERFLLPGAHAINYLLYDVLGGGGIASLRNDPQGKGYAQILLDCPIEIPQSLVEDL